MSNKIKLEKYELLDYSNNNAFMGYVYYNPETDKFSITLADDYTGKYPDLYFRICIQRGLKEMPQDMVDEFIEERVLPPNRQGLSDILQRIGLKEYNIHDIIVYNKGISDVDRLWFKRIE